GCRVGRQPAPRAASAWRFLDGEPLMAIRILNRSFSGGEITPELFGRLDLSKVQEALALCMNFITLPHGPVVNRPGTEYVEEVKNSASPTRLIPFSYNNTQTFAIQVGEGYFRFHTQGGTLQCGTLPSYVTPSQVTISIANPAVVTWNSHNLGLNAPIVFSTTGALPTGITAGVTYYAVNRTTNTFQLATSVDGAGIATSGTQSGIHTCSVAYDIGDAVVFSGVNYYCIQPNTNQAPPNVSYWYAMPANGDYEIPNPYAASDLMDIHYTQSADVLTLVHPNNSILELRRYGATNWHLVPVSFAPMIGAPVGTTNTGSPTTHQYVVTAVVRQSQRVYGQGGGTSGKVVSKQFESLPSPASGASCDLTMPGSYISLSWTSYQAMGYAGAGTNGRSNHTVGYRVYKLLGGIYQLIGESPGTTFQDTHFISMAANAGRQPPAGSVFGAPAAPTPTAYTATVQTLSATATGTGTISYSYVVTALDASGSESYASSAAPCVNNLATAGNYNTINWPSVDSAARYNVYKQSYGIYGFIGQVAKGTTSFVDNNITADISRTPPTADANQLSGPNDYPAAVAYYQQRRIFAGTTNQPQNVWATRSGTESDLTYTIPSRDDNRIAFRIAGREASAVRHIVPMQDLLLLSASCEWRCSSTSGVLTPATINVQPQSYIGANNVTPVVVGNAVLYAAARGGHIRQIGYNWQVNGYQSTDSSIFAPHLFDYNTIVDMAYSRGPIPILWCVSSSGKLLGMTWLPEQQISAWHQHTTGNGDVFESICTISENNEDMLYCIVRRNINGATKRFVERMHTRLYSTVADCHYVDCGATYNGALSKNGTYIRSGQNTLTCTITGHGLNDGQNYWFSFSDASLGTLPTGSQYQVSKVNADTFTISVASAAALSANNAGVSGAINGTNTAFDLLGASGETVGGLSGTPVIYKNDWQGTKQQYSTPRTNQFTYSEDLTNASWSWAVSAGGSAIKTGVVDPRGTTTAGTLTAGASGDLAVRAIYTLPAGAKSASIWLRRRSGTGVVNIVNADYTAWVAVSLTSAWQEFKSTVQNGATSLAAGVQLMNAGDSVDIAFANGDDASYTGSYIPTTTAAVTVTDYVLTNPAHVVFASAPAAGSTLSWSGSYYSASGTLTNLASAVSGLSWLNGMTVNILADGAVLPPQTVVGGAVTFPTGVSVAHIGLPITAQLQTPPAAAAIDPSMAQGLVKNLNKVWVRTYRSSGILAGPDFNHLVPYRQRTTESPGSAPNLVSDEIEIVLSNSWGMGGQICIQQSDPLPLDIASMTLEIAVGGGV
ncbi:MAG TPA: hypothetical protein VIU46_01760, partial [Gallionellaceae bacterium]